MSDLGDKIMAFRDTLSADEKPWLDLFVRTEGREPDNFLELMQYASGMQQINANERQFWGGVFGL